MDFEEISKSELKDTDLLWRYIDLHKLIDLAETMELHFTRCDQFSDPFEGLTFDLLARRDFSRKSRITNPAIDKALGKGYGESFNKEREKDFIEVKKKSIAMQSSQFVNCWIRSERESIAMWNLYSNRNSVAIRAKATELLNYFKRNLELQPYLYPSYHFICGSVTYLKINPFDHFVDPQLPKYSAFKKEVAFDFEKEFRFLIATPALEANSNPVFFRLALTRNFFDLLDVVCHPEMEDWKFKNVKTLCAKLNLGEPKRSEIEISL